MCKKCYKCKHFGQNVNQGIRYCLAGSKHFDETPDCCDLFDEYDCSIETIDSYSTTDIDTINRKFQSTDTYRRIMGVPGPISKSKLNVAKKRHKKERGIKHGRRK